MESEAFFAVMLPQGLCKASHDSAMSSVRAILSAANISGYLAWYAGVSKRQVKADVMHAPFAVLLCYRLGQRLQRMLTAREHVPR